MHRNFLLFEKQVSQISKQVIGKEIISVYTYRKNEIVILTNDDEFNLRICIDVNFPCFLLEKRAAIKQPKYELYKYLAKQQIKSISLKSSDKFIILETDEYSIHCIFYGKKPNILVNAADGRLKGSFKEYSTAELPESPRAFSLGEMNAAKLLLMFEKEPQQKLFFFLQRHLAAFNKTIILEVLFRSGLKGESVLNLISRQEIKTLAAVLKNIDNELSAGESFLYLRNDKLLRISPFHLNHMSIQDDIKENEFRDVNSAWIRFIQQKGQQDEFEHLKSRLSALLKKHKEYLERSLDKIKENEDLIERKKQSELKGNLLLTFKTEITKGQSEVELQNIFSDSLEIIKIKLNPSKDAAQNAIKYFNKFKNISKHKELLDIKKNTLSRDLDDFIEIEKKLLQAGSHSQLKKIEQILLDMKLLQQNERKSGHTSLQYNFNRLILDNNWEMYIGKNAVNNDLLTFQFANKWDIWLHAQGVSGSHVIIRVPRRDDNPPYKIIEQAARLAAANSRAKHSAAVPVIYTQVRFVHRIRKALPGTVSVKNEKVIFVNPLLQ